MEKKISTGEQEADKIVVDEQTGDVFPLKSEKKIPMKFTSPNRVYLTIRFFILLGFVSPVYYLLIWRKIPDPDLKLIATVVVGVAVLLLFILKQMGKYTGFEVASKIIPILLTTFGALLAPLVIPAQHLELTFKIFIVLFFSLLPGGLYVHFIWTKGKTLADEYILNLYRLHIDKYANLPEPPKRSIFHQRWLRERDKQSKDQSLYLKKFQALFGPSPSDGTSTFATLQAENVWPVAIATLIISVGWILVVRPGALGKPFFGAEKQVELSSAYFLVDMLSSLCFVFLGAYFYISQMLLRRYFQNDLKTSAFISATMRIVTVVLLACVVDLLLKERDQSIQRRQAIAFVIGVFPFVAWQLIQTLIRWPFKWVLPVLKRKYSLDNLDGLNIWYESRLLEEGIEDMQNLATANLVDVILNTRIPVDRLIDWVDQSLLYLHLSKSKDYDGEDARAKLRHFGIRTATDLDDAFNSGDEELITRLEYLLNKDKEMEPSVLRCIHATFENEPNLYHVRQWKKFADLELKPETKALEDAQHSVTSHPGP